MRKRWIALLLISLCMMYSTAGAAKARDISSEADAVYHAEHLRSHINDVTCRVTGNYIKVRTAARSSAKVLGHVEQADVFVVQEIENGLVHIMVLESHKTSPDSWPGLEGWVTADYVDCNCSEAEYRSESGGNRISDSGYFPAGMPKKWYFSSGAGGWGTELTIAEDGAFTGYYHDWDGGGDDRYSGGCLQECVFSGRFSPAEKISEYEYRIVITELTLAQPAGLEFVRDDTLVTTSKPYGCSQGASFIIYLPGTPLERIPPVYFIWASVAADEWYTKAFALYNMTSAYGFNQAD